MNALPAFNALQAAKAYQNAEASATPEISGGGDFASLLSQSVGSAIDTNQQAEQQAVAAINGGGDLTQVVTAVSRAELALQTTVAVRDRVLQAYQDIIKMSI
jgi:flagellar hook-basal body complex protein FliE